MDFTSNHKHQLLSIFEDKIVFNGKKQTLLNAINMYTKRVLKVLDKEDITLMPIIDYV